VWRTEIATSSQELGKYNDWQTLLSNLALALLSIPLLGLPLAINYYRTGYKRMFFQTQELNLLEHLDTTIQDTSRFNAAFSGR